MKQGIKVENLKRSFYQKQKEEGVWGGIKSLFTGKINEVKAVDGISFDIQKGEIVGFIGPNGAGKTTTLKMLSGLIYPTDGTVNVNGFVPYERKKEFLKSLGLVMGQKSQLWSDLPPLESMLLNKDIYGIEDKPFNELVDYLSEILDVKEFMHTQVRKLSLGQRMKFELILSIVHQPSVLFLDEPTVGLDITAQRIIREFLLEYNRKYETTIILTSHNMDDVKKVCNRLIIINKGQKIYDGTVNELIKKYSVNKFLNITFEDQVSLKELKQFGEVVKAEELEVTLSVLRSEHVKVASALMNKYQVDNLDIADPEIESIIELIYKGG